MSVEAQLRMLRQSCCRRTPLGACGPFLRSSKGKGAQVDGTDDTEDESELAIEELADLQDADTGPDDTVPAQALGASLHPSYILEHLGRNVQVDCTSRAWGSNRESPGNQDQMDCPACVTCV